VNTAWVVTADYVSNGEVYGTSFVCLFQGILNGVLVQTLLAEVYKAYVVLGRELSEHITKTDSYLGSLQPYIDSSVNCEAHFDILADGSTNDRKVICSTWSKLQMQAWRAEDVSFDVDSSYREHVRWSHQSLAGMHSGVMHAGPYYEYSLAVNEIGKLVCIRE
jgi:hypothetical protein